MKAYLIIDSKEKFEGIPQDTNQSVEKYGIPLNSLYKRLERGAASGMELVPITKAQYESKHGKPVDFEKPTHRQRIMNRQVKASNDEPMSIGEKVGRATDLLGAGLGSGSIVAGAAGLGKQYEGVRPESVIGYAPIVGGAIAGLLPELYAVSAATGPLGVAKAAQGVGNAATNTMRAMSLRAASPTMARVLAQHGRIASGITRSIPSGINYGLHRSARDAVSAYQEGRPVLPAAAQGALVGGAGGLFGGGVEGLIKYGNPSVLRNIAGEAVGGVAWNAAEDVVGRAIGQAPMTGVDYAVELAADIAMGIAGGKGDIAPLFKGSNLDQIRKNIRVVKDGSDSYIEVYGKRVPQPLTNKDAIVAREKAYQKIATASQTGTDVRTMFLGKDNPVMMVTKTEQGAPSSTDVYRRNTEDAPASIAAVDEQAPVEENVPSNNRLKLKKKSQTIVSEQEPVVEETAPIVPVAEQGKTEELAKENLVVDRGEANPVANQEEIRMASNRLDEAEAIQTKPVANQIANEQIAKPNPIESLFEENERLQRQYREALRSGSEEKIASAIKDIENTFGQKRDFTSLLKETKEILDRANIDDANVRTIQANPPVTNQAVDDYPELNKGTARVLAGYEHGPKTITAYAGADSSDMAHEVTHHIVNNITFSAEEEAALSSRYPDYKKNKVNQERLARDAAEWWKNKSGYTNVDKVLRRVYRKIINAVKRWVHKHGKGLTEEDVFYAMFSGDVGKRRAGTDSRMGSFSSAKNTEDTPFFMRTMKITNAKGMPNVADSIIPHFKKLGVDDKELGALGIKEWLSENKKLIDGKWRVRLEDLRDHIAENAIDIKFFKYGGSENDIRPGETDIRRGKAQWDEPQYTIPGHDGAIEFVASIPKIKDKRLDITGTSHAYLERNVLGWLRGAWHRIDGAYVFLIDEIQSDVASKVRNGEMEPNELSELYGDRWYRILVKKAIDYAVRRGASRVAITTSLTHKQRYDAGRTSVKRNIKKKFYADDAKDNIDNILNVFRDYVLRKDGYSDDKEMNEYANGEIWSSQFGEADGTMERAGVAFFSAARWYNRKALSLDGAVDKLRKDLESIAEDAFTVVSYDEVILDAQGKKISTRPQSQTLGKLALWSGSSPDRFKDIVDAVKSNNYEGREFVAKLKPTGEGYENLYDKEAATWLNRYVKQWGVKLEDGEIKSHPVKMFEITPKVSDSVITEGQSTFSSAKNIEGDGEIDRQAKDFVDKRIGEERKGSMLNRIATAGKDVPPISMSIKSYMEQIGSLPRKKYIVAGEAVEKHMANLDETRYEIEDSDTVSGQKNPEGFDIVFAWRMAVQGRARRLVNDLLINKLAKDNDKADDARKKLLDLREKISDYPETLLEDSESRFLKKILGSIDKATKEETDVSELFPQEAMAAIEKLDDAAKMFKVVAEESKLLPSKDADDISKLKQELSDLEDSKEFESAIALKHIIKKRKKLDASIKKLEGFLSKYSGLGEDAFIPRQDQDEVASELSAFGREDEGGLIRVSDLHKTILKLKEDLLKLKKDLLTGGKKKVTIRNVKKIVDANKRASELRKKIKKLSAVSGENIDITPGKDLGVRTIDGESIRVGLPYIFRGAYTSDDAVITNPAAPNTMQTVELGDNMKFKDNIVVPVAAVHMANDRRFVVVYTLDDGEINFHNIEINRGDKGKYQPIDDGSIDSINAEINKLQDEYEKAVSAGKTDLADTFANRIDELVWQGEDKKAAATNRYKGSGRSVDVADLVLASNDNMAFAPPSLKANANLDERILRDALSGDVEKENRKFMQYLGSNNINRSWLRMAKKITGFKFGSIDAARDAIDSARKNLPKKKQALLMDRERLVGLKKKSNNQGGIPASEANPKIDKISLEIEDIDSRIRAIKILDTSIKNFGKTQDRSLYRLEELHNLPKEKRKKFEDEYQSLLSAFVQYKTQGEEPYTLGKSTVDSGSYSAARNIRDNMERIRAESLASRTVMARAKAAANRVAKSFRMFQDLPSSPKFAAARELTVQIESMLNNVFKHANSSVDAWVGNINKNDIRLFSDWMILRDAQYTEKSKGVVFEEFKDWESELEKVESEIDKRGLREKFNETTKTRQQEFLRLAKLQQKEGVITEAQLKEIEKNLSYFHRQIVGFQRSRSGRKRFVNPKTELPSIQREIENMRTRLDEDAPGLDDRAIEKRRKAIEKKEKLAETLAGYDDVIYIDKKLKNVNIIESDIDAFNQMYRSIAVGRFKRLLFGKYDESMSMDSVIRNLRKVDNIRTSSGAYLTKEKLMGLKYEDAIAPGGVFSHVKDPEQLDLLKQYLHFEDVVKFSDFPKDSIMWKTIEDSPALVKIFNNIFGTAYIDKHIAEHLAAMNFSSNRYENMTALRKAVKKTSNAMRVSIILNPVRFPMYKTRNIYGDFARTITSRVTSNKGTSAKDLLIQAKRSFSDVRRWIYDNNSVTGELRDEMQFLADSGLLTGGLTASTIDPIVQSRKLKTLLLAIEGGKTGIIENVLLSGKDAFSKLQTFNEFSEAVLRVASYRIRKKQLEVWNREGRKAFDWGASNKGEAIDIFNSLGIDHAAKYMANNDIGAYSHVSQFTKEMNDIFMFLRYTTTSMTTAYRSSRNAIQYARELAAEANKQGDGGKALAKMLMGAVMATTPAWATAMAYAWNNALFEEQEEQLPDYLKYSPHLNLGGGPNGYITFGNAGDMTDVWSKLGLKELMNNYDDLAKGRITAGKYFGEALKGGLMEWINMLGVDIKLASEITTGMTTFPQVQPITKTQSIMGAFGLGGLLKIADRESPVRVMSGLHIKSKKQNAMTATWHNIDKWRVANDKEREGVFPKDLSYQGMKRAAESNNIAMFKKNKAKYDKSFKDFVKRLDFLNPKRSIAQKDHRSLYKFLDEKEREDMRIADAYAKELKTKMIQMWKQSERGR